MVPEINLVDPDVYQRCGAPHEALRWLREHAPVFWHADGGVPGWPGFWAVTRLAEIEEVSRNPDAFSSSRRLATFAESSDSAMELQRLMMLNMDPPRHTRQRGFVNQGFTPRMIGRLEKHIREICEGLIDDVALRGAAEFVRDIAAPLPLYVICELMGAPAADRMNLFALSNRLVGFDDPDFRTGPGENAMTAAMEMYAYGHDLAAQRREQPQDDIVTRLLQPDDAGEVLSADEFDMFFLLLVVAGNETTRNAAAGGMLAFFEHPQQWQRLLADPGLIPAMAEEIVRWVSPVNILRRTAARDTVLGGQRIAEGDKVVLFYSSANRDEDVFEHPFAFDIGRDPNPHVGFGGGGPHFCLGRHLAALELRVLFETIAERMPGVRLDGEVRRLRSNLINGIKDMPVRFDPLPPRR
jgi:cholest-4-en-3-one 26-monooxygenase